MYILQVVEMEKPSMSILLALKGIHLHVQNAGGERDASACTYCWR
jgi:hypothetical protein